MKCYYNIKGQCMKEKKMKFMCPFNGYGCKDYKEVEEHDIQDKSNIRDRK